MHRAFIALFSAVLLASMPVSQAADDPGNTVRIYNWADYIGDTTLADFERATGMVIYDTYDSYETVQGKFLSGRSGYDLALLKASLVPLLIKGHVFQPLDTSRLPDGATCLLTLHFIPAEQRLQTLEALWQRLLPGAPLVVAHHSFPQAAQKKARWLQRYAAFAVDSGVPAADAGRAITAISAQLPVLSPEEDAALMSQAGFEGVKLFYAGFSSKGWVGYKPR